MVFPNNFVNVQKSEFRSQISEDRKRKCPPLRDTRSSVLIPSLIPGKKVFGLRVDLKDLPFLRAYSDVTPNTFISDIKIDQLTNKTTRE